MRVKRMCKEALGQGGYEYRGGAFVKGYKQVVLVTTIVSQYRIPSNSINYRSVLCAFMIFVIDFGCSWSSVKTQNTFKTTCIQRFSA